MKNSYVESFVKGYPQVTLPLSEEQIAKISLALSAVLEKKYVAKSERVACMQRELSLAQELCARAEGLASKWGKDKNDKRALAMFPEFSIATPKYEAFIKDGTSSAVSSRASDAEKRANDYVRKMQNTAFMMRDNLVFAREQLLCDLEAEQKGVDGESTVESYLRRSLDYRILSGVILPAVRDNESDPRTAETDLLVFAQNGVFVCEIKNYGKAGQTLEVQQNGEIVKKDYYGRPLEYIASPFKQNNRHVAAVEKVLHDAGLGCIPVYSAVIIANTDVNVVNNSNRCVMDMYQFRDTVVAGVNTLNLTSEQQYSAYTAIQNSRMGERKFPIVAVSPIADIYREAMDGLEEAHKNHRQWATTTANAVNSWREQVFAAWRKKNRWIVAWGNVLEGNKFGNFVFFIVAFIMLFFVMTMETVMPPRNTYTYLTAMGCYCVCHFGLMLMRDDKSVAKEVVGPNSFFYLLRKSVGLFFSRLLFALIPAVLIILDLFQFICF